MSLKERGLLRIVWSDTGRRTLKYHQILDERLGLDPDERALLTVLLLRGPQAPGELRTRTERLHALADRGEVAACTADRGYGESSVEDALHDLGVRHVVIPRKGKPSTARRSVEHRPAFRRTVNWRTGSEGRISALKRQYGWDRTRIDTTEGAPIWAGHGILTHNLVKISALAA